MDLTRRNKRSFCRNHKSWYTRPSKQDVKFWNTSKSTSRHKTQKNP